MGMVTSNSAPIHGLRRLWLASGGLQWPVRGGAVGAQSVCPKGRGEFRVPSANHRISETHAAREESTTPSPEHSAGWG